MTGPFAHLSPYLATNSAANTSNPERFERSEPRQQERIGRLSRFEVYYRKFIGSRSEGPRLALERIIQLVRHSVSRRLSNICLSYQYHPLTPEMTLQLPRPESVFPKWRIFVAHLAWRPILQHFSPLGVLVLAIVAALEIDEHEASRGVHPTVATIAELFAEPCA